MSIEEISDGIKLKIDKISNSISKISDNVRHLNHIILSKFKKYEELSFKEANGLTYDS